MYPVSDMYAKKMLADQKLRHVPLIVNFVRIHTTLCVNSSKRQRCDFDLSDCARKYSQNLQMYIEH